MEEELRLFLKTIDETNFENKIDGLIVFCEQKYLEKNNILDNNLKKVFLDTKPHLKSSFESKKHLISQAIELLLIDYHTIVKNKIEI